MEDYVEEPNKSKPESSMTPGPPGYVFISIWFFTFLTLYYVLVLCLFI